MTMPATSHLSWMSVTRLLFLLHLIIVSCAAQDGSTVVRKIGIVKQYWANIGEYRNVKENGFGVEDTGLPEGCQVEQAQILHRHSARYPSSDENLVILGFRAKVVTRPAGEEFTGPLSFINSWTYQIGNNQLIPAGVAIAYTSGTTFWTDYGRLLFNATPGQVGYNESGLDKPLVRCNQLARVSNTAQAWAAGFFGQYNATAKYNLLQVPFSAAENSTLSAFLSCRNYLTPGTGLFASLPRFTAYAEVYLQAALERLSPFFPSSINVTVEDVFGMQMLCPYEFYALGSSEFCRLFTLDEWIGFEYFYDSYFQNVVGFGSAAGRAVGIGYLQEIIARLNDQFITVSNTSVNSTKDSSSATFPLGQKFYADFTNDFTIVGLLAAMSLDYFKVDLPAVFPPPADRTFRMRQLVPFAGHLIVEKIGCVSADPVARMRSVTQYAPGTYGYSSSNAPNKFLRMRLNNGILPLNTIRGGACNVTGRTDGLCSVTNFINSQAEALSLANYPFICFANYTIPSDVKIDDGTYFPSSR